MGRKGDKKVSEPSPLRPGKTTSPKEEDGGGDEVLFPFAFEHSNDAAENAGNVDETYSIGHVIESCRSPPLMDFSSSMKGMQIVRSPSSPQTLASFKEQLIKFTQLRDGLYNSNTDRQGSKSSSITQDYIYVNQ